MAQVRTRYIPVTVIGGQGSDMAGYPQQVFVTVLLLVSCGVGQAAAGAEGWDPLRQVGNIPALLARTPMAAPAARVYRVISDYDHFADFVPAVSASRVVARSGANTRVYQRLDLPMLVADRHYVIRVRDALDAAQRVIRVTWQLDESRSRALPPGDALLPETFTGYWRLTDTPDGSGCDAVYSIHVDPGGRLPAWLYSRAAERYVTDVVEAVRQRATQPQ
jgi:ribosome-associated toxin RatA of RatAB toxin-antitoxin module